MKKLLGFLLWLQVFSAFASSDLFSITPVGTLPTFLYDGVTATVQYTVTNNASYALKKSGLRFVPAGQTPVGVTQVTGAGLCAASFDLEPGASCTLQLLLTTNNFVNGVAMGGPEICNTISNPVHCSIPSSGNQLNITTGPYTSPYFTLSTATTMPVSMYYETSDTVTYNVINNSPYSLSGATINMLPTITGGTVTVPAMTNTCLGTIAPLASCSFVVSFTSGTTTQTVTGGPHLCANNVPPAPAGNHCGLPPAAQVLSISVTGFPPPDLVLTPLAPVPTSVYYYETTSAQYTVMNNTPYPMTGIQFINNGVIDPLGHPSTTPSWLTSTSNTCSGTLAVGASCTYNFTVTESNGPPSQVLQGGPEICGIPTPTPLPPLPVTCVSTISSNQLSITTQGYPTATLTLTRFQTGSEPEPPPNCVL